jgi:hypothetical protein
VRPVRRDRRSGVTSDGCDFGVARCNRAAGKPALSHDVDVEGRCVFAEAENQKKGLVKHGRSRLDRVSLPGRR